MKNNILRVGAVVALAVAALTGCAPSDYNQGNIVEDNPDNNIYHNDRMLKENIYLLSDGREVVCLALLGVRQGGLSCDWEGAQ